MNKTVLDDKRLSFKATGLLTYLLGKPDNWFINYYNLVHSKTDGIHSITSAFKELMKFGYIHKLQFRSNDGTYDSYHYLVFEKPKTSSSVKTITQPKSGFPISDNQVLLINKRKKLIKQQQPSTLNKSNIIAVAVAKLSSKNKKTETVLLLRELKIRNHKKLFALFSFSDIFKYANWIKDKNCRMKNPTGFLITAIKEKWLDNLDADPDDSETFLFYYKCQKCGKVFSYVDPIRDYDFCNKCGGIY